MLMNQAIQTLLVATGLATALACSGGGGGGGASGTPAGQSCAAATQCYAGLDAAALHGQVTCLSQLQNGYCTHACQTDADCCAVAGECEGVQEVCAPLQSASGTYCLVSCSSAAIAAFPNAGTTDPTTYCQRWANASFTCRSTGGGHDNMMFCGP